MKNFLKCGETLRSSGLRGGGGETDLTVLWYLLQVVPQDVLPAVTAGEALVQSLQVQVFSLQVAQLGLYGLPLCYYDLQQGLEIAGTVAE